MSFPQIDATARNQGYYKVYADDAYVSQHVAEREAFERAAEVLSVRSTAKVYYVHEYTVDVLLSTAAPDPVPPPAEPAPYITPVPSSEALDLLDLIGTLIPEPSSDSYFTSANPDAAVGEFARRHTDWLIHWLVQPSTSGGKGRPMAVCWHGAVFTWKDFQGRLLVGGLST